MTRRGGARPIALVRPVSPRLEAGERTHLPRVSIDLERARRQHRAYANALRALGVELIELRPLPDAPDGVFVEDCAVVTGALAVLARPGVGARRAEVPSVAEVLKRYRPLTSIAAPGTLDGGDVLLCGRDVFVGRTARTDPRGTAQLRTLLEPGDYRVTSVPVTGCLHLKSAVSTLPDGALLLNPAWVDPAAFGDRTCVPVPGAEPRGANVLTIGKSVLAPADCPVTIASLRERGYRVRPVECDELAKAEGGLTCCSIVLAG